MLIRYVDIPRPTHYRWWPVGNREEAIFQHVIDEREARLNEFADRLAYYESVDPKIKKSYDDAKAANDGRLLKPPLYSPPDQF